MGNGPALTEQAQGLRNKCTDQAAWNPVRFVRSKVSMTRRLRHAKNIEAWQITDPGGSLKAAEDEA